MKIITWNCNMAFRKKWPLILKEQPDIMVIQECEHISKYKEKEQIPGLNEMLWIGDSAHKGLGVFSFGDYHISISENYNPEFRYILPIDVKHKRSIGKMYAIWAMPHRQKKNGYVGQIWNAFRFYDINANEKNILIGDFNSNSIWDKERKDGNHGQLVEKLESYDISSIYHSKRMEEHGQETQPTIYLLKQEKRPFHIDYCFVSEELKGKNTMLSVGKYNDWIKWSDHMPIIVKGIDF